MEAESCLGTPRVESIATGRGKDRSIKIGFSVPTRARDRSELNSSYGGRGAKECG